VLLQVIASGLRAASLLRANDRIVDDMLAVDAAGA
jgi:hypothetical protein